LVGTVTVVEPVQTSSLPESEPVPEVPCPGETEPPPPDEDDCGGRPGFAAPVAEPLLPLSSAGGWMADTPPGNPMTWC